MLTMGTRTILHADLDAFYASAEVLDEPALRGQPVIVGGDRRRGVVLAASYEARARGAKSAIPMARALQMVPDAIVRPPRFRRYAELSEQFFAVLAGFSPLIEPLSLDEAFLDCTGEERLLGDGAAIARQIRATCRAEVGLAVSVGIAPSKFLAKIASDVAKPDGIKEVRLEDALAFLHPLPIERLWGVGKVTGEALRALGLSTIGELARYPQDSLRRRFGDAGAHLWSLAQGHDDRPVVPERAPVSLGHEDTFSEDLHDEESVRLHLLTQADQVAARLRGRHLRARIVVLKLKLSDFRVLTRRRTLDSSTCDGWTLGRVAGELLHALRHELHLETQGVRLCGVTCAGLCDEGESEQLPLDQPARARGEALGHAVDRIAEKFGKAAIGRAAQADPRGTSRLLRPRGEKPEPD